LKQFSSILRKEVQGTNNGKRALSARRVGESGDACKMDILAAIFAYLGCLAGVFGALTISAFLVLSPSTRSTSPVQVVQTAIVEAKASGTGILDVNAIKAAAPRDPVTTVAQNSDPVTSDTPRADPRSKTRISRAQQRRLIQEERARRWAYQDEGFEKRFMSYAD
jgi:hypothetical protein